MPTFSDFYRACTGHAPFPWQEQAAQQMLAGQPPERVAIPTGLGKTGLILAWVWALAHCDPGSGRRVPMRLVHVSPRRTIVDQTAELINRAAAVLADPDLAPEGELREAARWVAERLLRFSGQEGVPLAAARLRGGVYRDPTWYGRVDQPCAIAATADMAGSAFLLRYWVGSASIRPVLGGLLGVDCCWILDEAHAQQPLVHTLQRCREAEAHSPLSLPWWFLQTSATLVDGVSLLSPADLEHPVVSKRLAVKRRLVLHSASSQTSTQTLVQLALQAAQTSKTVMVITNHVWEASQVATQLQKAADSPEVLVLHGQQREYDRLHALARAEQFFGMDSPPVPANGRPVFLVATNAIEIGADLSADHMVTLVCPGDSLLQRLGRLGRRADRDRYTCDVVLAVPPQTATPSKESPYRAACAATAAHLKQVQAGAAGTLEVSALETCGLDAPELAAPSADPTPLFATGLRALTRTRPAPLDTPNVDALIHGCGNQDRSVYLAWRSDMVPGNQQDWGELLQQWPLRTHELLSVPIWDLQRWLSRLSQGSQRPFWLQDPDRGGHLSADPGELRSGHVVIVPSSYGGHDGHGFRADAIQAVQDLADWAGPRPQTTRLRLQPELLPERSSAACRLLLQQLRGLDNQVEAEGAIRRTLEALQGDEQLSELTHQAVSVLLAVLDDPAKRWAWEWRGEQGLAIREVGPALEDDEPSCAVSVSLADHQADVADRAVAMARRVGVPETFVEAERQGALLHDAGKVPQCFQALLCWPRPVDPAAPPLAKSALTRAQGRQAASATGVPARFRHEALSAALAAEVASDLGAHLAGASHGWGRPWYPPTDRRLHGSSAARLDGREATVIGNPLQEGFPHGLADRFERLNDTLGPWSLAWLEATLRLADWLASAEPRLGVPAPGVCETPGRAPRKQSAPLVSAPASGHDIRLGGISPYSAAGWLTLLGLLGLSARLVGPDCVTLRWEETALRPVPVLRSPKHPDELLSAILQELQGARHEWVQHAAWQQLTLDGDLARSLEQERPLRLYPAGSPESLSGVFCRCTSWGVRLGGGLGGLSGCRRVASVVGSVAQRVSASNLRSTLFGPWQPLALPQTLRGSGFGLDEITVSRASDFGEQRAGMPARDLLAFLGAAWVPGAEFVAQLATDELSGQPGGSTQRHMVWATWTEPLGPADVSVLISRPELRAVVEKSAGPRSRAAHALRAWSITGVYVSTAMQYAMRENAKYALWLEASRVTL